MHGSAIKQQDPVNVLLCNDSAILRVTLRKIIESDPGLRIIDMARNGAEAIEKTLRLKPDVVTLDVHMPIVDGLTALKDIVRLKIAPVIMLTATTREDAQATVEAMESGAYDFIPKPDEVTGLEYHAAAIIQKIKEAAHANIYSKMDRESLRPGTRANRFWETQPEVMPGQLATTDEPVPDVDDSDLPNFTAVVLGVSTGGPKSITRVLPQLPVGLNAAVIIVQHMPPAFITLLAQRLNRKTAMECVESAAEMKIEPGRIYFARGGYHLKLLRHGSGPILIRQTRTPPHLFMPSADITMNSVCNIFKHNSVGVLMTGMGRDGAEGMVSIRKSGGATIAESEETAIAFGMPQAAIRKGGAQRVLPNWDIAAEIVKAVKIRVRETQNSTPNKPGADQ